MPSFNIKYEDRVRLRHMLDASLEIQRFVIIGMRNRLVHAYFSINLNVVWETSTKDILTLIEILERYLK